MSDRFVARCWDTCGDVWDTVTQRVVSTHHLIRDAEAEAARLNSLPQPAAPRLYTPAEVAAREAAAAREMREACAAWCMGKEATSRSYGSHADAYEIAARNLGDLPIPAPGALARLLAEAEARGREAEREACALIVKAKHEAEEFYDDASAYAAHVLRDCEDAIRARKE